MTPKHGLLLFITSCLSGCGQMYQGYMKRGLSLLLLFFVILAVSGFLGLAALAFFLPVVWLYAFFDSYNLRAQIAAGTQPADDFLFGLSDLDSQRMAKLLRSRHSLIGWALILVGGWMLYRMLLNRLGWLLGEWSYWLYDLLYDLPRLVITILVIALGIWFIRGPKARQPKDIPVFTPPASEPWETQGQPEPDISREASGAGDAASSEQEVPRDER